MELSHKRHSMKMEQQAHMGLSNDGGLSQKHIPMSRTARMANLLSKPSPVSQGTCAEITEHGHPDLPCAQQILIYMPSRGEHVAKDYIRKLKTKTPINRRITMLIEPPAAHNCSNCMKQQFDIALSGAIVALCAVQL